MPNRSEVNLKWRTVAHDMLISTSHRSHARFFTTFLLACGVFVAPVEVLGSSFKDCPDCPEMIVIPSGEFQMGHDRWRKHEKPVHLVRISQEFAIGKTEITQKQWKSIMGVNPSHHTECSDDCPVDWVSWVDIQEFLQRLNSKTGKNYRLPSEAEWEYACRAGQTHDQCGSNVLDEVAWYGKNSAHWWGQRSPKPVARKKPNAWGLYDMSGNIGEWTADCWNASYDGAPTDGSTWTTGDCAMRPLRGGAYDFASFQINAANRGRAKAEDHSSAVGFRVVRDLP